MVEQAPGDAWRVITTVVDENARHGGDYNSTPLRLATLSIHRRIAAHGVWARSMPEVQQELAVARGTLSLSQQRAFGPWMPGLTMVQARHRLSALHALW